MRFCIKVYKLFQLWWIFAYKLKLTELQEWLRTWFLKPTKNSKNGPQCSWKTNLASKSIIKYAFWRLKYGGLTFHFRTTVNVINNLTRSFYRNYYRVILTKKVTSYYRIFVVILWQKHEKTQKTILWSVLKFFVHIG